MNTRGPFKLTARMSSIGSIESRTVVFIHDPIIAHHRITGAQRRCLAHGSGCTRLLDWAGYDLSFEMFPRHLGIMVSGASYECYFVLVAVESRMSLRSFRSLKREKQINAKEEHLVQGSVYINVLRSNDRVEGRHGTRLRQPGEEVRDVRRSTLTKPSVDLVEGVQSMTTIENDELYEHSCTISCRGCKRQVRVPKMVER